MSAWTRPNVYGYGRASLVPDPSFFANGWHVIDDIRYTAANDGTIAFDYLKDPQDSTAPFTIREDSWMGVESDGLAFQGEVRVQNGATLTFEADPTGNRTIDFAGGLFIGNGRIVVGDGVTLRFGDGEQLIVFGELDVNGGSQGVTFAPISTSNGWGGLSYRPNSSGTVKNATVTGVDTGASGANDNSVYVWNADVTLRGVTIQDGAGDGLYVTGSQADVTMRPNGPRLSEILRHTHRGVVSASSADVSLSNVFIEESGSVAVYTINGGDIFMQRSSVNIAGQAGARAHDQGRIVFGFNAIGPVGGNAGQNNLLERTQNNTLRAEFGATIYGGGAGQLYDDNYRNNWFRINSTNPNQNHARLDGADIIAECSYWDLASGPDPSRIQIANTTVSIFDGTPYLTQPPNVSTACGTTNVAAAQSRAGSRVRAAERGGVSPSETETGDRSGSADGAGPAEDVDADRWYAIAEGVENADPEVGIEYAMRAIERSATPAEAHRAFEVAAQLGRDEVHPGLEVFLGEQSQMPTQRGPALEALASIYYGTGRLDQARSTANVLLAEYPATEHARRAWLTRYATARDMGNFSDAEVALAAVEAGWPAYDAATLRGDLAAAQTLGLAKSEGRLSEGGAFGRDTPGTLAEDRTVLEQITPSAQAAAGAEGLPETTELGAPYPNPTAAGVTVPLALAHDAEVTLVLVNTLGRQVRRLASGAHAAGRQAYEIATAGLAPGVYMVQATVTTRHGTARYTERLTVLR
ncbi:MAG: T9SS type A sorting domain-containing protein [Bacteroidota bacterium]